MTNPTLERADKAAKREIDRLRKRRVEVAPGRFSDGLGWENLNEVVSAATRAVLMAVREPDEAVCKFGRAADDASDWGGSRRQGEVFTAMIDAILNDGECDEPPLTD